jgi:hypothetical protein
MTGTDGAGPAAGSPAERNKGGGANHSDGCQALYERRFA